MSVSVPSIIATASPLFVCNFCLYSDIENQAFVNNCFCVQKAFFPRAYAPKAIFGFLRLLAESNARASELLGIRAIDNVRGNRFLIRGLKRSRNYTIIVPGNWIERPPKPDPRWNDRIMPFTYNQLYRWCVKIGIGNLRPGRKTFCRTHAARYDTAQAVFEIAGERAAGDCLHHNSHKSINYYINKKESSHG